MVSLALSHDLFNPGVGLDEKVLRSLLVFVFLVIALRLAGKRELGQLNVLDLAVIFLVSNALQNGLIGDDQSVTGAVVGASTLFAANFLFVRLTFSSARARRVLEGTPTILLRDGKLDRDNMWKEAITEPELVNAALEKGFDDLSMVGLIVLETNGQLVCLGPEQARRLRPQMVEEAG